MKFVVRLRWLLAASVVGAACLPTVGAAQAVLTKQMGIEQHLGAKLPLDIPFKDEMGQTVTLKNYIGARPLIVLPIFYSCETGCALITDGLVKTILAAQHPTGALGMLANARGTHPLTLGRDFDVVMLSINPAETPQLAANKKVLINESLKDPQVDAHWHLLTGSLENIRRVTDAMGFSFYYNPYTKVINHPTGSAILTPAGAISAYTIGNDFPTKLLEDDLALAAKNEISTEKADQTFMFGCVMLDPATGKIRFVVEGLVRLGMLITFLVLAGYIIIMLRRERKGGLPTGGRLTGA
ncbi:MAG TPA: SCO family protein [Fimbriimonas sp.]|nr:SCO family protein [Fimbriimonas sp.]